MYISGANIKTTMGHPVTKGQKLSKLCEFPTKLGVGRRGVRLRPCRWHQFLLENIFLLNICMLAI